MRFPPSVVALGLAVAMIATACGSSSTSPSPSEQGTAGPTGSGAAATLPATAEPTASAAPARTPILTVSPDQLIFPDRLLICSDVRSTPPMSYFDESGTPAGVDPELGQEIAARLGLVPVIVDSLSATIIEAAIAGKCDIIMSSMTITAERKERVEFITYFQAGHSFVVATGNLENIHTQEDLCGKSIAALTGSAQAAVLEGTGAFEGKGLSAGCEAAGLDPIDVQTYQSDSDALLALQSGQVSAYFADSPSAGYNVAQHPDSFELSGLMLDVVKQGIAVPIERPDLKAQVQRILGTMVRDGTYITILEKFGVADGNVFSQ